LEEKNFDYERFAKEFIKQMPGSITAIPLQEFVDEYIAFVKRNRADKTYNGVKLVCKKLLSYFSPIKRIDTITIKDAEGFLESLKATAPKGVYNYHRTLRAMFNKAVEWNYLRENVFEKIKLPKRQQNEPDYISETEMEAVCFYINNDTIKDAVRFTFYTGIRLGELVRIKWTSIDLKKRILVVGDQNWITKGKKQRIIPLSEKVAGVLLGGVPQAAVIKDHTPALSQREREKDKYVFAKSNGMPYTTDCISKNFKRAARKAGIDERIHFHSLRHSAASMMAKNGAPITAVKDILGHSSISTTMIYTHSNLETLRDAVNRI